MPLSEYRHFFKYLRNYSSNGRPDVPKPEHRSISFNEAVDSRSNNSNNRCSTCFQSFAVILTVLNNSNLQSNSNKILKFHSNEITQNNQITRWKKNMSSRSGVWETQNELLMIFCKPCCRARGWNTK